MLVLFASTILLASFFVWIVFLSTRKPNNFPPGPPRLPLIGSIPYLRGSGKKTSLLRGITELVKKHGKIVGFYLGNTPAIILADYSLIKEAFKNDALAARPSFPLMEDTRPGHEKMDRAINGGMPGVVGTHGQYWKELRRFMLRNLRDFGFGKSSMEDLFQEEAEKLCNVLSKTAGEKIDLLGTMNISIVNALWSIVIGERLSIEDPNMKTICKRINDFAVTITVNGASPLALILPRSMAKWPLLDYLSGFKLTKDAIDSIVSLISPYIDEHEKTLDANNVRDFLDVMLLEKRNQKDNPGSCFDSNLGEVTIVNSLIEIFLAGMETTSSSLVMAVLLLLHHPEVQEKLHKELDSVSDIYPTLADKDKLPYVNAVIQESHRVISLASCGVPHFALEDVEIQGFAIPKGSTVMSGLYHAMRDPEHFHDPEIFKPERFIDKDGNFIYDERVIPFGLGKRYCLGQSLAEKEFFIFFSRLLKTFNFNHDPMTILPSYIDNFPELSLMRSAPKYEVILQKR